MDNVIRLLLRVLLVPLGYLAAGLAATIVVLIAWWQFVDPSIGPSPDGPDFAVLGAIIGAPILLIVMLGSILPPISVGLLISEVLALRSWIFHVLNGIVSMWVGWQLFGADAGTGLPTEQPTVVIAAGVAAGFAYWVVAGFSAGFYKPVFRHEAPPTVPATGR